MNMGSFRSSSSPLRSFSFLDGHLDFRCLLSVSQVNGAGDFIELPRLQSQFERVEKLLEDRQSAIHRNRKGLDIPQVGASRPVLPAGASLLTLNCSPVQPGRIVTILREAER